MNSFAESLITLAESTKPNRKESDYIKNGLLYCGKCNTAKQVEINICGKVTRPYCMCKCEEKEELERRSGMSLQLKREEIERNRHSGFLDIDMMAYRFENDDRANPKISDISKRYVEHFDRMLEKGKGLMFLGNAGTGKSFMAGCIANALIDKGVKCLITNFPRILNEVSGMFEGKQAYTDNLNNYKLLVIDDFAIERETEYTAEIVQNVIDSRYRAGLPLIITTNLTRAELESPKSIKKERLFSRLYEMCLPLAVVGQDRRKANAVIKDAEIKSLLGV